MGIADLDKEMTVAEAEEKDAQADYEKLMKDSAEKRAADSKTIGEKEGVKADTEAALTKHKEELKSQKSEMMATLEVFRIARRMRLAPPVFRRAKRGEDERDRCDHQS